MVKRRSDDTTDEGLLLRAHPTRRATASAWILSNWFSLIVAFVMLLNLGGWIKTQEHSDVDQIRRLGELQTQLDHHITTDDQVFERKDVLVPELQALNEQLAALSKLIELERTEREAAQRR